MEGRKPLSSALTGRRAEFSLSADGRLQNLPMLEPLEPPASPPRVASIVDEGGAMQGVSVQSLTSSSQHGSSGPDSIGDAILVSRQAGPSNWKLTSLSDESDLAAGRKARTDADQRYVIHHAAYTFDSPPRETHCSDDAPSSSWQPGVSSLSMVTDSQASSRARRLIPVPVDDDNSTSSSAEKVEGAVAQSPAPVTHARAPAVPTPSSEATSGACCTPTNLSASGACGPSGERLGERLVHALNESSSPDGPVDARRNSASSPLDPSAKGASSSSFSALTREAVEQRAVERAYAPFGKVESSAIRPVEPGLAPSPATVASVASMTASMATMGAKPSRGTVATMEACKALTQTQTPSLSFDAEPTPVRTLLFT